MLSLRDVSILRNACKLVKEGTGHTPYLVGSALERPDYRDVDVRSILPDDEYDALFGQREDLWHLFCLAVSSLLSTMTGLPVDYQVQRQTQANEQYNGRRDALGIGSLTYSAEWHHTHEKAKGAA